MTGLTSTTLPKPGTWHVSFTVTQDALLAFNDLAEACLQRGPTCPTGQVAIVVDGEVLTAPTIQAPEFERDAFALSDLNQASARSIAARLSE
ncbi:MAG: SecDF P1 head subdomain-containing protein [Actinomycetota bacterium]